jgi:hypothetical protein
MANVSVNNITADDANVRMADAASGTGMFTTAGVAAYYMSFEYNIALSTVCVPGDMPEITCASNDESAFEKSLQSANDNLCKPATPDDTFQATQNCGRK